MYGKSISARGKNVSEDDMSTEALAEARNWYGALMDAEYQGRGDREKSVRGRLSDRLGITESYLYRLQYKAAEMKDIAGEAYRRLMIGYDNLCAKNEEAARRTRAARMELRSHDEVDQVIGQQGMASNSAGD